MANLWDDITKTIKEGVDAVVEKTEELTKIGRIKVDILNIKRKIEKNFTELGGKVYHLIAEKNNTQIADEKAVMDIIEQIKNFEKELQDKNVELAKVRTKEEFKEKAKPESKPKPKPPAKPKPKSPAAAKSRTVKSKAEAKK
ncbi:MAG: hypothetical protein ACE5JB_07815 [bacterium]